MQQVIERTVERIKENIISPEEAAELKRMTTYRLSDAIREGSKVTTQARAWVSGDSMCAMSAAVCAAKARGYM